MNLLNIALVDDDLLVLTLLRDFIQSQPKIEVQLIAQSGEELLTALRKSTQLPDIVLADLKMDGMNGAEVTEALKLEFPSISIIVISSHYKTALIGFMIKAGVSAFFPKGIPPMQLIGIIRTVHRQGYYFTEEQLSVIREQLSHKVPAPLLETNQLSPREIEIIKLICQQKTAKEIAELLFISQSTVEGHKNNLFVKTGAKNIAGMVIYALQFGIIDLESLPVI